MRSLFFLVLSVAVLLAGCAGSRSGAAGAALAGAGTSAAEAPRDSLRAKFQLKIMAEEGKVQEFDAVLFSVLSLCSALPFSREAYTCEGVRFQPHQRWCDL